MKNTFDIVTRNILIGAGIYIMQGILFSEPVVTLADQKKALMPIVVSSSATNSLDAAKTLAQYLRQISGADFSITREGNGIILGKIADFPSLRKSLSFSDASTNKDDYRILSYDQGLYLIGASDLAVEFAIWDFLWRLGYRQFFPPKKWEYIPSLTSIKVKIDVYEHPDFLTRRIFPGFGFWPERPEDRMLWQEWEKKNRVYTGFLLNTGHSYNTIIARNREIFITHPEYLALINGKRTHPDSGSAKFCISNPDLRKLVIAYAKKEIETNPACADSVSLDPSDGSDWCECQNCKKMGSVSDRVVILANQAAEVITSFYPDKFVGMYAYNQHAPAPRVKVHPNVVVAVATKFNPQPDEECIADWQKQGASCGVRDYLSVSPWHRDLPGQALGANMQYLQKKFPAWYKKGARYYITETDNAAGPLGLGHYLVSRILWDVDEADSIKKNTEDFLEKMFPSGIKEMSQFYNLLDASTKTMMSDDLLARLYASLSKTLEKSSNAQERSRLADLAGYVRYIELYRAYTSGSGKVRQKNFELLLQHIYSIRDSGMVHSYGLARDMPKRDKQVTVPEGCAWDDDKNTNPWKTTTALEEEVLLGFIAEGLEKYKMLSFQPIAYSMDLVPAEDLELQTEQSSGFNAMCTRGETEFYVWVSEAPADISLTVSAGMIAHYRDRGPAKLELWPALEPELKMTGQAEVPPDGLPHEITLSTKYKGLQRIVLNDAGAMTVTSWPEDTYFVFTKGPTSLSKDGKVWSRWSAYFYVPKGTEIIGGYHEKNSTGTMTDSDGTVRYSFAKDPNFFSIEVPDGQDGRLWRINAVAGDIQLMTVPQIFARNAAELLLPKEVVKKNSY